MRRDLDVWHVWLRCTLRSCQASIIVSGEESAVPDEIGFDCSNAGDVPSVEGLAHGPHLLARAVAEVQAAKPYPANYVPRWMRDRTGNRPLAGGIVATPATTAEESSAPSKLQKYRGSGGAIGWVYAPGDWSELPSTLPSVAVPTPRGIETAVHTAEEVVHIAHVFDSCAEVWDVGPDVVVHGVRYWLHHVAVVLGVLLTAWAKVRKLLP